MSLDEVLAAATVERDREEWLNARDRGFGCSDLGALWLILGWVGEDEFDWHEVEVNGKSKWVSDLYTAAPNGERDYVTPRYLMESWRTMKKSGLPRLIAEKCGKAKPQGQSDAQNEGKAKERQLFQQSRLGQWNTEAQYGPDCAELPTYWSDQVVFERGGSWVLRDRYEPGLLCTLEAWEHTPKGTVAWELKTDRLGLRTKPPWAQRLQAIGQAVVMGADGWGIQYGPRWAQTDEPSFPDLPDPVQWGPFKVKDSDRAMVRKAVSLGMEMVRNAMKEMGT